MEIFENFEIEADSGIKHINDFAKAVAKSTAPILILGPTGTGKSRIASKIHEESGRNGKFVDVNCGAFTPTLIESELFGHVKGAFTGAVSDRKGAFVSAENGTVFLDEIGELHLELQSKLLTVLQEQKIRPLGSDSETKTNCRIITATNKDIVSMVKGKTFRDDLYYRIAVITIILPALKDRSPKYREKLIEKLFKDMKGKYQSKVSMPQQIVKFLVEKDFPGNIRQLSAFIEHAIILAQFENAKDLTTDLFPTHKDTLAFDVPEAEDAPEIKGSKEKLEKLVMQHEGRINFDFAETMATKLGISTRQVYRLMKKYGITPLRKKQQQGEAGEQKIKPATKARPAKKTSKKASKETAKKQEEPAKKQEEPAKKQEEPAQEKRMALVAKPRKKQEKKQQKGTVSEDAVKEKILEVLGEENEPITGADIKEKVIQKLIEEAGGLSAIEEPDDFENKTITILIELLLKLAESSEIESTMYDDQVFFSKRRI